MTDTSPANRRRRPPPPPPALPSFHRAGPGDAAPGQSGEVARTASPPDAGSIPRFRSAGGAPNWRPLPMPRLMRDAPIEEDPFATQGQQQPLLAGRMGWTAILSWGFAIVVLLLVVAPTDALGNLTSRGAFPISGAGYGPLIAVFAILAIVVAFGGLLWIWVAMSRDYETDADDRPGL